ncbi:MAG: DUF4440 domain-containing protein [Robiginitomaculum sp.]|nr:MAG: DUF4440 domain-containing protein [Robiginitomaculum sp.]
MTILQNRLAKSVLTLSLLLTCACSTTKQTSIVPPTTAVEASSDLYKTIMAKDHALFKVAFYDCDETGYNKLLSESFEFYHDKGGATLNKAEFIKSSRERRCEKEVGLKRKLITESMKIYPLYKNNELYGAVQTADHDFYIRDQDGASKLVETATFTHLWLMQEQEWKISRALSFNHISIP